MEGIGDMLNMENKILTGNRIDIERIAILDKSRIGNTSRKLTVK